MKTAKSYAISIWLWGLGLGNLGLMLICPEALIISAIASIIPFTLLVPLIHFLMRQDWQITNKTALLMLYSTFAGYLSTVFTLDMIVHAEGLFPNTLDFSLKSLSDVWKLGLGVIPFIIGVNVGVAFGWQKLAENQEHPNPVTN
jgi:hypothetical protein